MWPFLKVREDRLTSIRGVELIAYRGRYGPIYEGKLIRDSAKPILILAGGSANDLKPLVELGHALAVPVIPGKGMDKYAPSWLQLES